MNIEEYIKSKMRDGCSVDEICQEFADSVNNINKNKFQEDIMDPLMDYVEIYYRTKDKDRYEKVFPCGISQQSVESVLDMVLEMGELIQKIEPSIEKNNLDSKKFIEELVKRLFA